ncbi:MAG: DUF4256 domain-containing protein [Bacteroidales bacterium]
MSKTEANRLLPESVKKDLLEILSARFGKHPGRHKGIGWGDVLKRLEANEGRLWSLYEMEKTGGEPDVIGLDTKTGEYIFFDCSAESPKDRRSLCYDEEALEERKEFKPSASAVGMAGEMGIELMTVDQYRLLQTLGSFDSKTSSWLKTPPEIRKLGGAIFGDRRYDSVFVYHNGVQSYYAARGFRGTLRV